MAEAPHVPGASTRWRCAFGSPGRPSPRGRLLAAALPLVAAAGGASAGGGAAWARATPVGSGEQDPPWQLALRSLGGHGEGAANLSELRRLRNSQRVLQDVEALYSVTGALDQAMQAAYEGDAAAAPKDLQRCFVAAANSNGVVPCPSGSSASADGEGGAEAARRPGNFHGVKSHSYYVGAISEAHPTLPPEAVQSIVASEWYHPGLTAKAVWCTSECGAAGFPLARRLDANFRAIQREVDAFWRDPVAMAELRGVGSHTTQFDRLIAGNGTWVDVRLWRGRAFNRRLCERYFRVVCGIVEASPEVWTNPWSHVLLSILLHDSWVPFHQGHTNGQLTYHLPVRVPRTSGVAELAVVDRGGTLADDKASRGSLFEHPEERTVRWTEGQTLVFDDSFTHAVRFRSGLAGGAAADAGAAARSDAREGGGKLEEARVVLLMRGWHPELPPEEREALRDFIRKGGEEEPEGYELLPVGSAAFGL